MPPPASHVRVATGTGAPRCGLHSREASGWQSESPIRVTYPSPLSLSSPRSFGAPARLRRCWPSSRQRRRGRAGGRAAAGPLDHGMVRSAHHGSAPAAADGARGGRGRQSPLRGGRPRRYGCIAARRGQGGFGCGGRVQRQVLVRGNSWGEVGRWGEGGVAWL